MALALRSKNRRQYKQNFNSVPRLKSLVTRRDKPSESELLTFGPVIDSHSLSS